MSEWEIGPLFKMEGMIVKPHGSRVRIGVDSDQGPVMFDMPLGYARKVLRELERTIKALDKKQQISS